MAEWETVLPEWETDPMEILLPEWETGSMEIVLPEWETGPKAIVLAESEPVLITPKITDCRVLDVSTASFCNKHEVWVRLLRSPIGNVPSTIL
jgi:hypothetical protein